MEFALEVRSHYCVVFPPLSRRGSGWLSWQSARFVIKRSRVRSSAPHVTAVARKSLRSFCQNCTWQVTTKDAYTLDTPWIELCRSGLTMFSEDLSGKTSLHSTRQGTPVHGRLSSLRHCGLIPGLKIHFKKKCRWGMIGRIFTLNHRMPGE